jgi:hypothetical protein
MKVLSDEMVLHILSFLNSPELVSLGRVSKRHLALSRDGREWRRRYEDVYERAKETGYDVCFINPLNNETDFLSVMKKGMQWIAFVIKAFQPINANPHLYFLWKIIPQANRDFEAGGLWKKMANLRPYEFGVNSRLCRDLNGLIGEIDQVEHATEHALINLVYRARQGMSHSIAVSWDTSSFYTLDESAIGHTFQYPVQDTRMYCVWRCVRYVWRVDLPDGDMDKKMRKMNESLCRGEYQLSPVSRPDPPRNGKRKRDAFLSINRWLRARVC